MEVQKIAGVAAVQPQQGPEPVQARTQSQTGDSAIPEKPRITPAVVYTSISPNPRTQRDEEAASLLERMMEAQKKAKEQREKFRFPKNSNYGDRPMEAYARLSRARTRSQVGAAAGYARRQIAQLRAAKRQDSENAPRIQAAINQLERAVVRAGRKKRELDQEQLTEARSRRLEEGKELKKAQTLRQELRRRQRLRMIRERGYIKEAEIDNRCQQEMAATRAQYQASLEGLSGVPGNPLSAQATGGAPAASTGEAAPAPELSIQA